MRLLAESIEDGWIPREALEFREEESREVFQRGSAVFLRNWPYVYGLLAGENSPVAGKFDVAPLPGPNALGGWNLGISSCSTRRGTARDFIRFLTSEANQRKPFEKAGAGPTLAALYEDQRLRAKIPYLDVLRESLERSRERPRPPSPTTRTSATPSRNTSATRSPGPPPPTTGCRTWPTASTGSPIPAEPATGASRCRSARCRSG